ncbi:hypothetical protein FZM83_12235 [Enterococcus faecium]|nr:hypothetical protein [Enterococcus faecium]
MSQPLFYKLYFSCQLLGHKSQDPTNMRSCFLKLLLVTQSETADSQPLYFGNASPTTASSGNTKIPFFAGAFGKCNSRAEQIIP